MKTTLAEYIFMERNDIFKQQEAIENATKFFNELKTLYNEIDIEDSNNDVARSPNDKQQSNDHKDSAPEKKISHLKNTSQLSRSSKSVDDKEFAKLNEAPNLQNEDDMFGIISMHAPISSKSKKTNDNYRQDLLRQIEDKKKRKQLEIEREKAADEEIEKKIAQQRLSLYMDYLEERKRGDFIVKCKHIEHESNLNGDCGQNGKGVVFSNLEKSHLENKNTNQEQIDIKESKVSPESDEAIAASKDLNILANLSEVRKIMQHDHIEMLEKLLELHIK